MNGTVHLPGATIPMVDVREDLPDDPGLSLVCVTINVNTMCCSNVDTPGIIPVGKWLWPNGTAVKGINGNPNGDFTRRFYTEEIRLNRKRPDVMSPTGVYTCAVPDENTTMIHTATITLCESHCLNINTIVIIKHDKINVL